MPSSPPFLSGILPFRHESPEIHGGNFRRFLSGALATIAAFSFLLVSCGRRGNETAPGEHKADPIMQALEHRRESLDLDRQTGDKVRIINSLTTLAGICLTAKELDEGEKYILEAIRYSTEAKDSNLMAIQYGMASEIYHAMRKNELALYYARRACDLDTLPGNRGKMGIRLSQMASAQIALGQHAEAERSLKRAIPILEEAGNERLLSICCNQMGELLNRRGAHAEAARNFRQAAEVFAAQNDMYNESRARKGLFEALKGSDLAEAARHLVRYSVLKDSIYHRDMEQAVSQQNARFKTEELLRQQELDRDAQRMVVFGGIALVAILLFIVGMLVYSSRIRRRNHLALKRLAALRENFFANITHEFRTPLTVILGMSRDLQNSDSGEVKSKAQTIRRQVDGLLTLLTLINQLLDISKVKAAVGNADWKNGNIVAYLTMIVESYRDYARSRNIDLQFQPKGEVVVMDFVPDYVGKVLNNLLSNAFKFTPEHGMVSVTAWREGERLHIDVADTGKGMDKETMRHVFEPFYQGHGDVQEIGTRMGLALVKQIMEAVNGEITVESKPGAGTTFHLSVPIRNKVRQKMPDTPVGAKPLPPKGEPALADSEEGDSQCRLLVIEDNRDLSAYIGSQFAGRYAVSYAADGEDGLEKAQELVPDLIITDLMMPGMDGLEVCRQVRGNDIINHIPIIIVTAKITEEERIEGLEAGADAYLTKPFNLEELRTRVEKLLEGRRLLQEKYARATTERKEDGEQQVTQFSNADLRFLSKTSDAIYMQINRNKSVDVSLIASNLCMSYRQFHRKLVALTGYTPTAYIQRIKIKQAKTLLDNHPQMSFSEVAEKCGFSDYSNFVRAFKNTMGITPTDYRNTTDV